MKPFQNMQSVLLLALIGAVEILTLTVAYRCEAATELLKIRRESQKTPSGSFSRLVLDLKGERPTDMSSPSPNEFVISFRELRSKLAKETPVSDTTATVTGIKILDADKGSQILVQLRSGDSSINHSFLPPHGSNQGLYRLLLDVLPLTKKQPADAHGKSLRTVTPSGHNLPETAKSEASLEKTELKEPKYKDVDELNLPDALKKANDLLARGSYKEALEEYDQFLKKQPLSQDELSLALFGLSDSYYFAHEKELAEKAPEVISHYLNAIKVEPWLHRAAWAYYRCGTAYQSIGKHLNAIELFQRAIQDYPKHPALSMCWIGLGISYQQTVAYPQAISALRSALELPLDQPQKAKAHWLLGSILYASGDYGGAAGSLELTLKEDAHWYRKQPLILKYLGDSYFVLKQFDKSREFLLRYFNLQPDFPDKDLTLAMIAELFSVQGEQTHAGKLYDHIRETYPDSEGDVIAQIRTADFLKSKDRISPRDDLEVFRELARRPLPPQLFKLVLWKLASREYEYGNYEESLATLDYLRQRNTDAAPNSECLALRSKVIMDWSTHAFNNQDYERVIQLWESNEEFLADVNSSEFLFMIADSFNKVKQYKKAFALYDQIIAKNRIKEEEDILVRMAECSFQAEDFGSALKLCSQIKEPRLKEKKAEILARVYFTQHDYAKVIECLGCHPEGEKFMSSSLELSRIYGESLYRLGEYEKAIPWLQRIPEQLTKAGSDADEIIRAYTILATCFSKLKRYDLAVTTLEDASRIASTETQRNQLDYDIAKNLVELGQRERAITTLTNLMKSTQGFWQTAAKQQLDYVQMEQK